MISCYCVFHCTLGLVCFPILLFATLFGRLLCLPPIYRVSRIFLLSGEKFICPSLGVCLFVHSQDKLSETDGQFVLYICFNQPQSNSLPIRRVSHGFLLSTLHWVFVCLSIRRTCFPETSLQFKLCDCFLYLKPASLASCLHHYYLLFYCLGN